MHVYVCEAFLRLGVDTMTECTAKMSFKHARWHRAHTNTRAAQSIVTLGTDGEPHILCNKSRALGESGGRKSISFYKFGITQLKA